MDSEREPVFDEPQDPTERANKILEERGGLPEDNPFAEVVRNLREEGQTWAEISNALQATYGIVDEVR